VKKKKKNKSEVLITIMRIENIVLPKEKKFTDPAKSLKG